MSDLILRSTGKQAELRFVAVNFTETANKILKTHEAEGGLAVLISDTLLASVLMSSGIKFQGSVRIETEFNGIVQKISAESTPMGLARAKFEINPEFSSAGESELQPQTFRVKKFDNHNKMLSEGIVPMDSLSMGKNLASYLLQSEQIRSAVAIVTRIHPNNPQKVLFAAAYLVEAFPKCDEKTLSIMEQVIHTFPDFADFVEEDQSFNVYKLLETLAGPFEYEIHREIVPEYYKPADRETFIRALSSLQEQDLLNLIEAGETIEMTDDYSRISHHFTIADLKEILEQKHQE